MKNRFVSALCVLAGLGLASVASAQTPAPAVPESSARWGVTASVAPWDATGAFKGLLEAQAVNLTGGEFRAGVTRGHARGGDWSIVFVRKTVAQGGTLTDGFGQKFEIGPDVVLTGAMVETFDPFVKPAGGRVQVGLILGGGLAKVSGLARQLPDGQMVSAQSVLTFFAKEAPVQFLGRAEFAVAVAMAPGVKIRASGGFDWPGRTQFGVTVLYFFGDK